MNIQEGKYKLPWDMTTRGHRQFSPTYILGKASRFVTEAFQTLERRDAGKPDPVWLGSGMYPDYYLNTFHYQVSGMLHVSMQLRSCTLQPATQNVDQLAEEKQPATELPLGTWRLPAEVNVCLQCCIEAFGWAELTGGEMWRLVFGMKQVMV